MTRRDRQRAALHEEIKATARRLMTEHGTAGVSLRLIARELEMSAPSLYHYFPSYDALITALIVDAFNALADALAAADSGDSPHARMLNVARAFRDWALVQPIDFQLIYGNPIPGFHAPPEVTVPAVVRGYTILAGILAEALPEVDDPDGIARTIPSSIAAFLATQRAERGYPVSTAVLYATIVLWTRMYGCVMLEVFNHLQPSVGDSAAFYMAQINQTLREFGIM